MKPCPQPAKSGPRKTATFRAQRWSVTGAGLDGGEIRAWRRQLAGLILTEALAREAGFWHQVDEVRHSTRPAAKAVAISNRYAHGKRRRVIVRLLALAASAEDRGLAELALANAGARAVFADEGRDGRPAHYKVGGPFLAPLLDAATSLAHRGAGLCLVPDCCQGRANPSDYCRRHDGDPLHSYRERQIKRLFELAGPAVLGRWSFWGGDLKRLAAATARERAA